MFHLNCKGRLVTLQQPVVMGIINITPDSFYSGSRISKIDEILFKAEEMIRDGAFIIDIGGQSTRPNSRLLEAHDELERVIPAIKALHKRFPELLISIDTFFSQVAEAAVHEGACMVNDISAGSIDNELTGTVARLQVPYVLMHMRGMPQDMQEHAQYSNVSLEVFDSLNKKVKQLEQSGIPDIIIDPGFGFAKNIEQNLQLLNHLHFFKNIGKPLLAGLSRKATIYKTLQISAEEALNGTTVMNTIALEQGAGMLRVHDVKEAVQAIQLHTVYKQQKEQL